MAHEHYLRALDTRPVREQAQELLRLTTGGDDGASVAFELFQT
jgi:hypothetical protein